MTLKVQLRVPRTGFDVDVKFEVPAGRTLAIIGPSGSGKSTIVHAIAGIQEITAGRIELSGNVLADAVAHRPPHLREVGLLGQDPHLFPHLDALKNIAFGARAGGMDKSVAKVAASEWIERLGLQEIATHRPEALSGGQRQRIALARALAARPKILLIDEPFASLDVEAAMDMRSLVREELARTATSAIVVSHSAADTLALADDLLVLERGKIIQRGTVAEVFADPANRFVRAVVATLPAHPISIQEEQP
ncbi:MULTISPECIES: ATP-binding cassette domain-containing protein [Glutamicibacter]|uniref:ATP-binding cassette domain-containing protein n=1 Tax=Glutamicibacter bergerei TaxID=256702 RepID=A0ABV9MIF9_9MICC